MGRELRRKQAKKEGKSLKEEKVNENSYNDIYKLLKIFGIILFIILIIYFFVAIFITKEIDLFNKEEKQEETTKVSNSILAKNIFMQKEEEYYIYFYSFNDEDYNISSLINTKLSESKVYKVNTEDAFNSNYVTKEERGNSTATSIDNLKVINPTLIKISNDVIVEYYETTGDIQKYLNNIKED